MTKIGALLMAALVPCLLCGTAAASLEGVSLLSDDPFETYQDSIPRLYDLEGITVRVFPSRTPGILSWRPFCRESPCGRTSSGFLSEIVRRSVGSSTGLALRSSFSSQCIRRSVEEGKLLPTIYLPLDMPPILARTIGEGGQLDISGSQKITLSGITHYRPNAVQTEGQSQSLFPDLRMEQELRVQLDGTIGEKIHVEVDHDSEREMQPENRIRLAYEGWEDEIIQSIEMGDVSLSITGPEFVSYSIPHEGLFGAKVIAQAGPVDITTIASKEASSTESAEFVGQATMIADTLLDIYPANNYFYLTFPDSVTQPGIFDIRVFRDDLDGTNNDETGAVEGEWFIPLASGDSTGTGWWDELLPGADLDFVLVDSATAIRLHTPVNDNHMLAVWMVTAAGDTIGSTSPGSFSLKLIKESNPLPSYRTWDYELRNRYFLGANNIVQESFTCDIYLAEPGEDPVSTQDGTPFIELLGLDTNGDGLLSDEEDAVDWDNGFLVFPDLRPFESPLLEVPNPLVYSERNPEPSQSLYYFAVGYRAASTTFSLGRLGIVPGSENVTLTVNGVSQTLVRDQDYTIVYEIGLLTLMGEAAELAQNPSNTLRVSFEYLPFLAQQQKTLFGTRAVYNISQGTWIGATAMFEDSRTPGDRPRVGEESTRTLVTDIDARFESRPVFLTDLANAVPGVSTDADSRFVLSGEVAASFPNPNTDNKAYIDDMEGTESAYPVGRNRVNWSRASSPVNLSPMVAPPGDLRWYNDTKRWNLGQIIPNASSEQANDDATILEMVFTPEFGSLQSWGGVMRCADKFGLDFSEKTRIRLWVRATGSAQGADLYLDLGERMDEDSYWLERVGDGFERRANGALDTEDADGNGIFSDDEDTGFDQLDNPDEPGYPQMGNDPNRDDYYYNDSDPPATRYLRVNGTEDNGRMDTEDLNGNGVLDGSDNFFRVRIPLDDPDYVLSGPNEYGWMLVEVPLSDSTLVTVPGFVTSTPTWEKISYMRVWMEGFSQQDTIDVYDFSIVGNRWEQRAVQAWDSIAPPVMPGEQLVVSTINNKDNPEYAADPPPGVSPGRDDNGDIKLEQSLVLDATGILPGHQGITTQSFYSSEDYTGYRTIRFPVHGDESAAGEFFFRMGRDTLNYYEISTPLTQGWQNVQIDLDDLSDLRVLKAERDLVYLRLGNLAVRGNPSFGDVMVMSAGIRNTTGGVLTTEAWMDDIVLLGPYGESGFAQRLSTTVEVADLLRLNGDYRRLGADFHGLGATTGLGATSTRYSSDATLYLERFTPRTWFLSMPATLAWKQQLSEPKLEPNSDRRLTDEEAWEQRTQTDDWNTGLTLRRNRSSSGSAVSRYLLDPWQLGHSYGITYGLSPSYRDTLQSARGEVKYDLSLGEQRLFRLPLVSYLQLRPTRFSWSVVRQNTWDTRWELGDQDTTQTRANSTRSLGTNGSVSFNFWQGQGTTYSLGVNRDLLYPWDRGLFFNAGRETSRNQNLGLSQEVNLWNYLFPRVSYDAAYNSSRLAPHTAGDDSLGSPDVSVSATRRLNLRIGLVHAIRALARTRDERLDEQASPGSPRWLLARLDRLADRISDPTIVISRTIGTQYRELGFYPGLGYQFGLDPTLEGIDPYDRTTSDNLQVSGGFRPLVSMSVRAEYSRTDTRHFYSGYWNRQLNRTWPALTVSWSGLERLAPLSNILRSGTLSTGYRIERNESGRFESDEYIPTSRTQSTRWSPLFSITGTFRNNVQITLSDNLTTTETRNFTGTQARNKSDSNSFQLNLQYAFSAPGGLAIPLPLLNRLRISFRSDLTTALRITRSRTVTRIVIPGYQDQVQSDREEWRIEPSLNYDFGSVTAGLTGIYGWKTDGVNSIYDQRDVGMDIWVLINF